MMTTEISTVEITEKMAVAYTKIQAETGDDWIKISEIAKAAGLTKTEIHRGIQELRTEDSFHTTPWQLAPYLLNAEAREYAITYGGDTRHLICWE